MATIGIHLWYDFSDAKFYYKDINGNIVEFVSPTDFSAIFTDSDSDSILMDQFGNVLSF